MKSGYMFDANSIKRMVAPLEFYRRQFTDVPLNKLGWNDGGLCCFHRDKIKGSFRVNTTTGGFICYSCGTRGGDIVDFTMSLHGLSFPDALAKLADDWGIT